MNKSVEEIAEELQLAASNGRQSQQVLAGLFAEKVEVRHVPPGPHDGPIPGQMLADVSGREVEALARALPSASEEQSDITVEGSSIRVRRLLRGVLGDGTSIELTTNTLFNVADGQIVGLVSEMDSASAESWRQVLSNGSLTT